MPSTRCSAVSARRSTPTSAPRLACRWVAPGAGGGRPGWAQYAGFVPALVLFGVFFLVPLGLIVCYSFWDHRRLQRRPRLDAGQLSLLLQRLDVRLDDLGDDLGLFRGDGADDRLAFPFAYWLVRYVSTALPAGLLLILVILPFWTSYLLRVYSWLTILGPEGADQPVPRSGRHFTDHPVSFFLYDRPAVILVLVYLYFPFAALTLYASLERFDWDQFKAAMDLGATPATAIRGILLRRSGRGSRPRSSSSSSRSSAST